MPKETNKQSKSSSTTKKKTTKSSTTKITKPKVPLKINTSSIKSEETIHYEMLFRTSAKAKLGQVIFINSDLYKAAYEWLTIGLGKLMQYS